MRFGQFIMSLLAVLILTAGIALALPTVRESPAGPANRTAGPITGNVFFSNEANMTSPLGESEDELIARLDLDLPQFPKTFKNASDDGEYEGSGFFDAHVVDADPDDDYDADDADSNDYNEINEYSDYGPEPQNGTLRFPRQVNFFGTC